MGPQSIKRKLADLTNPTFQSLLCSACTELPRVPPIYCCSRGHVLCVGCRPRVASCPFCRCLNIDQRSAFAERLLSNALDGLVLDCKNRGDGCTVRDLAYKVALHEEICVYREVGCPGSHRGACAWIGPLSKMLLHVIDNKCAQIVKDRSNHGSRFKSVIGDFNPEAKMTVFGRTGMTWWKPVLLISRTIIRLFAYLIFYRDQSGNWIGYVRSYASDEALGKLQVTITISKPDSESIKSTPKEFINLNNHDCAVKMGVDEDQGKQKPPHPIQDSNYKLSITCGIMGRKATEQDVIDSANYIVLKDSIVRRMTIDRTLLQYVVEVSEKD